MSSVSHIATKDPAKDRVSDTHAEESQSVISRSKSLWEQAAEAVLLQDKTVAETIKVCPDAQAELQKVKEVAEEKGQSCNDEQYVHLGRSPVRMREIYENVANWARKFIQTGDLIAQVDPLHVGIPWAAVRFVLQVRTQAVDVQPACTDHHGGIHQ